MEFGLVERVDSLEAVFGEFVSKVGGALIRMERSDETLKHEMADFKKEVGEALIRMERSTETLKREMSDFKNEMSDFKNELREENRNMNRRLGEIANRQGTITESLVTPSMQRIIRETFQVEAIDIATNRKRKLNGRIKEFDVITLAGERVFLTSVKTTLRNKYITDFVDEIKEFREFFPEYQDKKVVGILAALNIDENQVKFAEKKGFLVLGVGDEIMEVKNRKGFKPKLW